MYSHDVCHYGYPEATQIAGQLVRATHQRDCIRCPLYLSHLNDRIIAATTTDRRRIRVQPPTRIYDREAIKGGVRRGWEKGEESTNL